MPPPLSLLLALPGGTLPLPPPPVAPATERAMQPATAVEAQRATYLAFVRALT